MISHVSSTYLRIRHSTSRSSINTKKDSDLLSDLVILMI